MMSAYIPVMCTINHSVRRVIWRYISAYLVGSVRITVMCAVNHSVRRVIWKYMKAHIMGGGHIPVTCVSHLHVGIIWCHIIIYVVKGSHVMCVVSHLVVSIIWRHVSTNILGFVHIPVMFVIGHSLSRIIKRHLCMHIREQSYTCDVCSSKSFSQKYYPNKRKHIHTGGSFHTPVMCAIHHSVVKLAWRHINTLIVWSIHIGVMCVIDHIIII
jgi:hypothetical protein